MKNVAFAIWMVGYSFNMSWDYNNWCLRGEINGVLSNTQALSVVLSIAVWIGVGALLYEKRLNSM